jgi:transcription antitermination factor NusG
VDVKAPFFPGYLFVSLDLDCERWRSINGTVGVIRLVAFGSGGRPTPLPRGFVERLQELNDGNCPIANELRAGDRVRVIGGPLDDLCGALEGASDHERVTILLSLLGKETRVSLRRGSLIAA